MQQLLPVLCLMGPTGVGKTELAIEIVKRLPCEIISVDSAMIYRGMDIGTAKPQADVLRIAPHRLINFLDPSERYSAGQFRQDALNAILTVINKGKIPLLVGGTMLYFRVLQQGIAQLPQANPTLRATLFKRAEQEGWASLYAELTKYDPMAAKRIHPNDSQRIQRALEVHMLTGKPISEWQVNNTYPTSNYRFHHFILAPKERSNLRERLAQRFQNMLKAGFVEEVQRLYARGDLAPDMPSIRCVGYRQIWTYLEGEVNYTEMCEKAVAATRQLAKRQLTWLRAWHENAWIDCDSKDLLDQVVSQIAQLKIC